MSCLLAAAGAISVSHCFTLLTFTEAGNRHRIIIVIDLNNSSGRLIEVDNSMRTFLVETVIYYFIIYE